MVTKHRADLPVLCGCFPLAIYFTFGSVSCDKVRESHAILRSWVAQSKYYWTKIGATYTLQGFIYLFTGTPTMFQKWFEVTYKITARHYKTEVGLRYRQQCRREIRGQESPLCHSLHPRVTSGDAGPVPHPLCMPISSCEKWEGWNLPGGAVVQNNMCKASRTVPGKSYLLQKCQPREERWGGNKTRNRKQSIYRTSAHSPL